MSQHHVSESARLHGLYQDHAARQEFGEAEEVFERMRTALTDEEHDTETCPCDACHLYGKVREERGYLL